MIAVHVHKEELPAPISTLERYLRDGGRTLLQAVFENTFFVSPQVVRSRTPYYPEIQQAIKQASWDLFFRNDPVCEVPMFVQDPGMNLKKMLEGTPLLILEPGTYKAGIN